MYENVIGKLFFSFYALNCLTDENRICTLIEKKLTLEWLDVDLIKLDLRTLSGSSLRGFRTTQK